MAVFRVFLLSEYDKSLINFIVIQLKRVLILYTLIRIGLILLSDDNRDYYMLLFFVFCLYDLIHIKMYSKGVRI